MKGDSEAHSLATELGQSLKRDRLRYIELRPKQAFAAALAGCRPADSFCYHEVDLRPALSVLFTNCHKSSTQRKVLRAERESVKYESGRSPQLLEAFWNLLLLTRRRHLVPPQPKSWFRNLIDCFGEAIQIRVASKDGQPVASILTLRHKETMTYKYGCSDERFHRLGGTHLLFWRSIEEAKQDGLRAFDLGRTDWHNQGLLTFKDRWGAVRSTLTYLRFSASPQKATGSNCTRQISKVLIPYLPDSALRLLGSALYRHIA
jgi:lipid II:glycine glycyltransferase (peptidoglycan interpeptide bridge formation enzyme)